MKVKKGNVALFLTVVIVTVGICSAGLSQVLAVNLNQCNSNNPKNCPSPTQICDNGEHIGNPHCHPSPTPIPTKVPYHYTCREDECVKVEGVGDNSCNPDWIHDCYEVTPTPTVTVTPTGTPSATPIPSMGSMGGGSNIHTDTTEAPGALSCTIPFSAPILWGFDRISPTSVSFTWGKSTDTVDKYSIIYGYKTDSLVYGIDNIPSSSDTIVLSDLQVNVNVWAQVWAWRGGCAEKSGLLDP